MGAGRAHWPVSRRVARGVDLGGVAAIAALLRQCGRRIAIVVLGGRLAVTWWRGPVRFHRAFARDAIRRLLLTDREGALSPRGRRRARAALVARHARRAKRSADRARVRAGVAARRCGDASALVGGDRHSRRTACPDRRTARRAGSRARVGGGIAIVLAVLTLLTASKAVHDGPPSFPRASCWRSRARWRRASCGPIARAGNGTSAAGGSPSQALRLARARLLEARRLVLDVTSDSDGDEWFELYALGESDDAPAPDAIRGALQGLPRNRRTVVRLMNDSRRCATSQPGCRRHRELTSRIARRPRPGRPSSPACATCSRSPDRSAGGRRGSSIVWETQRGRRGLRQDEAGSSTSPSQYLRFRLGLSVTRLARSPAVSTGQ